MTAPARAPGIVAGIAFGLVAPVAFAFYDDFTRPFAEAPVIATDPSYLRVAIAALALASVGWAIVTRCNRVRSSFAWAAVLVGAVSFVLAARRPGEVDGERLVREMPIDGDLAVFGPPVQVGALTIALRRPEPGADTCNVDIVGPGRLATMIVISSFQGCVRVRVRHDAKNGIAVVEHVPVWAAPWSDVWTRLAVVSTHDGAPVALDARTFRRSLAIRPEWAAANGFTAAIALALLLSARAMRRRDASFARLLDAVHVGDGWFAIAGGRRILAGWARELPIGEYSVKLLEPGAVATYRDSAAPIVQLIARGKATAHARKARDLVMTYEGMAFVLAAIGAAPVVVGLVVLAA